MSNRRLGKGELVYVIRILAAQWKAMSDDEKKKYKDMADKVNNGGAA